MSETKHKEITVSVVVTVDADGIHCGPCRLRTMSHCALGCNYVVFADEDLTCFPRKYFRCPACLVGEAQRAAKRKEVTP